MTSTMVVIFTVSLMKSTMVDMRITIVDIATLPIVVM